METITLKKGEYLVRQGDMLKQVYIIVKGTMMMHTKNDHFPLKAGCIIGLVESTSITYMSDYYAEEDSVLVGYPFRYVEDFKHIFQEQPKYAYAFVHGAIIQCGDLMGLYEHVQKQLREYYDYSSTIYRVYHGLCEQNDIEISSLRFDDSLGMVTLSDEVAPWELAYNKAFATKDVELIKKMYENDLDLCIGEIQHASVAMYRAARALQEMLGYLEANKGYLLSPDRRDYFQRFFQLQKEFAARGIDQIEIQEYMKRIMDFIRNATLSMNLLYDQEMVEARIAEYEAFDFATVTPITAVENVQDSTEKVQTNLSVEIDEEPEQSIDCLEMILEYAGEKQENIVHIRKKIEEYRELPDIYSTDDAVRALRRELTKYFFEVYEKAFFRSVKEDEPLDEILLMFFNFGFMDVQLVGEENANLLCELTDHLYLCNSPHIFTIYSWLVAIYHGEKEPSRNEFDLDYAAYLREQIKTGQITKEEEEELAKNQDAKIRFEIHNMFTSTNRATYGKFTTYCPLLREEDLIKSVEDLLVTAEKIDNALNQVRQLDYSCFYRDIYFADPEHDLPRQEIKFEVLPDIILMPNAGSKGMMWQETADVRRDTPGRFMFPIFTAADIDDLMLETCGRFRWEICRKIQGMRWNDIRERSLTAEYCDYLQFYRKNRNLTADAKDKLKNALMKAKNNYREVFVRDYVNWLKYEAKGSVRLNKTARDIIFRYCPFSREKRKQLAESPMFRDLIEKFEILHARDAKHAENVLSRYEKAGGEMLPEMKEYLNYYNQ